MTENKWFNDFRGYKRFDSYFDDYMQLWVVSDNENDNMLYPCISENMANEFIKLLNELNDENQVLREQYADDCNEANSMTVKISELIEEKEQLKQSYNEFEDECQSTFNAMNRKQNDLYRKIFKLNDENEQLKSTIAQLIEQNRKNNDLLLSDIRILEKALWCGGCENDYGRLKELRKEFMK